MSFIPLIILSLLSCFLCLKILSLRFRKLRTLYYFPFIPHSLERNSSSAFTLRMFNISTLLFLLFLMKWKGGVRVSPRLGMCFQKLSWSGKNNNWFKFIHGGILWKNKRELMAKKLPHEVSEIIYTGMKSQWGTLFDPAPTHHQITSVDFTNAFLMQSIQKMKHTFPPPPKSTNWVKCGAVLKITRSHLFAKWPAAKPKRRKSLLHSFWK